jgi:hypothetical protein
MTAVILGDISPLVFRPTVVRECQHAPFAQWQPDCGEAVPMFGEYHARIGRTVPPVVPDFSEPCPDCDGIGMVDKLIEGVASFVVDRDCPTCDGTGVVQRVYLAERQERIMHDGQWDGWQADGFWMDETVKQNLTKNGYRQTRLAVVSWYPVTVLPVIDDDDEPPNPDGTFLMIYSGDYEGTVYLWDGPEDWAGTDVTDEPWASDLEPGCVVVIPGDEVRLDEPITEMVEPDVLLMTHPPKPSIVPLALQDGLNDVELAR